MSGFLSISKIMPFTFAPESDGLSFKCVSEYQAEEFYKELRDFKSVATFRRTKGNRPSLEVFCESPEYLKLINQIIGNKLQSQKVAFTLVSTSPDSVSLYCTSPKEAQRLLKFIPPAYLSKSSIHDDVLKITVKPKKVEKVFDILKKMKAQDKDVKNTVPAPQKMPIPSAPPAILSLPVPSAPFEEPSDLKQTKEILVLRSVGVADAYYTNQPTQGVELRFTNNIAADAFDKRWNEGISFTKTKEGHLFITDAQYKILAQKICENTVEAMDFSQFEQALKLG